MSQQFLDMMGPLALAVSEQTGLDPRLVIAQSALETGWGRSAPGNNFFGIKSHGRPGGNTLSTGEVVNGQPVQVTDSFRAYANPDESAADYANFLKTNPRYANLLQEKTLEGQIAALGRSGYATDPQYANKVAQIAKGIDPTTMKYTAAQLPSRSADTGSDGGDGGDPSAVRSRPPEDTSYVDSLLQGGPLALFGKGQKGYDWGRALQNVAAGLAAPYSPQQAAVYAQMAQSRDPAKHIQSQYDQNTGTWYHYDKRTGQTTSFQDPNWLQNRVNAAAGLKKAQADAAGAKSKDVETFRGGQANMDMTANIVNDMVDVRQAAAANPNAFGIYGKLRAQVGAALDGMGESGIAEAARKAFPTVSDDDIAALGKLQRVRNQLVALAQLPQKGQQTESDAKRYDLANFDQLSNLSGKALISTLDNLIDDHGRAYNRLHSYYKSDIQKFGADPRFNDGQFDYFANQKLSLDDRLKGYRSLTSAGQNAQVGAAPAANAPQAQPTQTLDDIFKKK